VANGHQTLKNKKIPPVSIESAPGVLSNAAHGCRHLNSRGPTHTPFCNIGICSCQSFKTVLRIHEKFWYGSGCGFGSANSYHWLMDPDPDTDLDPAIFFSDLQTSTNIIYLLLFSSLLITVLFKGTFTSCFKGPKHMDPTDPDPQHCLKQYFPSASGSTVTYRFMLIWIRLFALTKIRIWLFVRIRNTDLYHSENLQTGLQTLQGSILSPPSGWASTAPLWALKERNNFFLLHRQMYLRLRYLTISNIRVASINQSTT
jgi:hypothetical protein